MTEDKMKNMQKLDADDLEDVTGGSAITDLASTLLGIGSKNTMLNQVVKTAECCTNALKGNAAPDAGKGVNNKVTAYCPVCRKDTEFEVFSGARARCSVCGNIRLDM